MAELPIYRILDRPSVYRFVQFVLAPGGEQEVKRRLGAVWPTLPVAKRVVDVGCGPSSFLWKIGIRPIGLDVNEAYARDFAASGSLITTASALALPLSTASVDAAWCFFMLHHLNDAEARAAIRELQRVVKPGGYVAIWDGVLPVSAVRRPIAYVVRKADRGRFMRHEEQLRGLLPDPSDWKVYRRSYSLYGYERLELYRFQ